MSQLEAGRLHDKVAIITGATAGIGAAIVTLFRQQGAELVLVARNRERGERMVAELGDQHARFVAGDVCSEATARTAVDVAKKTYGRIDILINNAGIVQTGELLATELQSVQELFAVDVFGPLLMIREAVRSMKDRGRGGSVVNITSRHASVGIPNQAPYAAAKGALLSLTRAAAIELAPYGIRVNAVAPGLTMTSSVQEWINKQDDPVTFERERASDIPLGRIGSPNDVAQAVLYLASDESVHVTGTSLAVDGGYTAK
jgi:NAD(P)-dependent dehydrogenase (short-subunit alcohol dehydrogenase family)